MTDTPKTSKRFDGWDEVDCNDCSHYWDSSCDGVKTSVKATGKPCNGFLAVRSVDIPQKIERLRKAVKRLCWAFILTNVALALHIISHLLGAFK